MQQANKIYGPMAQTFHWFVAFAILGMFLLAGAMEVDFGSPDITRAIYTSHKTLGIIVLLVTLLRFGWRLAHKPPVDVPMPAWERIAAHGVHHLLYLLCFLMPLSGWAMTSAGPYGIKLFGIVPFPRLPVETLTDMIPEPRAFFAESHEVLASLLILLLVLHIGAALKHHFIDRDAVLLRMIHTRLYGVLLRLRWTSTSER